MASTSQGSLSTSVPSQSKIRARIEFMEYLCAAHCGAEPLGAARRCSCLLRVLLQVVQDSRAGQSAVDHEVVAVDEARVVAGQEGDRVGHLVGLAVAGHGRGLA